MNEQLEFNFLPAGYIPTGYVYARAGGPPDDWYDLVVLDLKTGKEISDVIEVYVNSGTVLSWADSYCVKIWKPYEDIIICKRVG